MDQIPKPADESRDLVDEHQKPAIVDKEHIPESPALVYLKVSSSGPTRTSAARILEDCLGLEVLDVQETHMATLELFYSGD